VPDKVSLSADYLLWWIRKQQIPALLSFGQFADAIPGAVGQSGTTLLVGPGSFDNSQQTGGRIAAVVWFDECHTSGIDGSFLGMEQRTRIFDATGWGAANERILARPYFNANTNLPDADPVAVPSVQSGTFVLAMPRQLYGGDVNFRFAWDVQWLTTIHLSYLVGGRFLSLTEKILIDDTTTALPGDGVAGVNFQLNDSFVARNRFAGGQVGILGDMSVGPLTLSMGAKVAIGQTDEILRIQGSTVLYDQATGETFIDATRGLLAQPTNVGRYRKNELGVIPEATFSLAWDLNGYVKLSAGYTFLFWSRVLRPGDQIDPVLNVQPLGTTELIGTAVRPLASMRSTGFWAQGVSIGLEVSY
jgi:hypothetical protein